MKIKICGITKKEEISYVNESGVNYVGFVFYPKSKRFVTFEEASKLKKNLKNDIKTVAVTVDPNDEQIKNIEKNEFDVIQIHTKKGNFFDEDVLSKINIPIWLGFNIDTVEDLKNYIFKLNEFSIKNRNKVKAIVMDNKDYGSGQSFEWNSENEFRKELESLRDNNNCRIILAGGLNSQNVSAGIKKFNPEVVDVSSSMEVE